MALLLRVSNPSIYLCDDGIDGSDDFGHDDDGCRRLYGGADDGGHGFGNGNDDGDDFNGGDDIYSDDDHGEDVGMTLSLW